MTYVPKHRAETDEDKARAYLHEMFKAKGPWSEYDFCYGVEDGLDGYAVHTRECGQPSWRGPDHGCKGDYKSTLDSIYYTPAKR